MPSSPCSTMNGWTAAGIRSASTDRVIMLDSYDLLRPVVQIGHSYCNQKVRKDLDIVQVVLD